jgi:hypothetical protein
MASARFMDEMSQPPMTTSFGSTIGSSDLSGT